MLSILTKMKILLFTILLVNSTFLASYSWSAVLSGRVTTTDNLPIANISVQIYMSNYGGCYESMQQSVQTDNDGYFEFITNSLGTYYVRTGGPYSGYEKLWWSSLGNTPKCGDGDELSIYETTFENNAINFQLAPEAIITGRVTSGGLPISNMTVSANITDNPCWDNTAAVATTDSNGDYTLNGLSSESYIIQTEDWSGGSEYIQERWAEGSSVQDCNLADYVSVVSGQTKPNIDLQLELGGTISGTIIDSATMTGVSYQSVEVFTTNFDACDYATNTYYGNTDSQGEYTVSGLPPGEYYITVNTYSSDYVEEWWAENGSVQNCLNAKKIILSGGQNVTGKDLQLEAGGSISGKVIDSVTMAGLAYQQLRIFSTDFNACSWNTNNTLYVDTDFQGEYTVTGLPPGEYYIEYNTYQGDYIKEWWAENGSVQSCLTAEKVIVATRQNVMDKDLQLEVGATISGRITSSSGGTPITNAYINAYPQDSSNCNFSSIYGSPDADGYYTIFGLIPGSYQLMAGAHGYIGESWSIAGNAYVYYDFDPVEVSTPGEAVLGKNFSLEPGVLVSGKVLNSNGQPISGVSVHATSNEAVCTRGDYNFYGYTNSQGKYEMYVLATYYYFSAEPRDTNYQNGWYNTTGTVNTCEGASVRRVRSSGISDLDFSLDIGATISGTLTDIQGEPVAGLSIYAQHTESGCDSYYMGSLYKYTTTDSSGAYTIEGLPASNYYISSQTGNNQYYLNGWYKSDIPETTTMNCDEATPVAVTHQEQKQEVNLQVEIGGKISGSVWENNGTTLALQSYSIMVYDHPPCSDPQNWVRSPWTSICSPVYTTAAMPAGEYYLGINSGNGVVSPASWWAFPETLSNCAQARKVVVAAGRTRENTDFFRTLPFGDVNGDGLIDLVDVLMDLQILIGKTPSPVILDMGDTNEDGVLDLVDTVQTMVEASN